MWAIRRRRLYSGTTLIGTVAGRCFLATDRAVHQLLVRLDPDAAANWSDEEVVRRSGRLFPPRDKARRPRPVSDEWVQGHLLNAAWVTRARQRLQSLSWFMKGLKEPLARLANHQDQTRGAFFEGRLKSIAILDEAALLAATTVSLAGTTRRPWADRSGRACRRRTVASRFQSVPHRGPLSHSYESLPSLWHPRAELTTRRFELGFRRLDRLVPPILLRPHHLLDVDVRYSPQQQSDAVDPLLQDLHEPMVPRAAKRRIGVEDRLACRRGPTVHATEPPITLHSANRTGIKLVMDQVAAVAVQINPFGELVGDHEHVRAEGAVKDRNQGVRLQVAEEERFLVPVPAGCANAQYPRAPFVPGSISG